MSAYLLKARRWAGVPCLLVMLALLGLVGCKSAEEKAKDYYESGLKLLQQGEPAKASLEFRNALKQKDDFIPALYSLGLAQERQGQFSDAAKIFFAVGERDPKDVDSRVHLASILLMAGQPDDALKFADQAYQLAPSNTEVLAVKAGIALKRDNRGDAVRFADAALAIDPKNANALIVRAAERLTASDPKGALAFLDRAGEGSQSNVGLQLLRITVLTALQDDKGVEGVFKSLINSYPKEAAFREGLVRWYISRGRKSDAEPVLRQFAADNPDNTQAELNLVTFLRAEQGADAAKGELLSRIKKGGNVFVYKSALAQLAFETGDYAGAVDQLHKLIADTDQSADLVSARLQLARMMMAKSDIQNAEPLIEAILADDDKNADALILRAAIRQQQGHLADAIEDLRAASNEAPQSAPIMQMLADAYERNGDVTLAEEEYGKLATSNPQGGINYANFLMRYGKVEQADRVLSDLNAASPHNKQVVTLLAQVKLARQDWVAAQQLSDALRELDKTTDDNTADRILAAALAGEKKYDESLKLLEADLASSPKDKAASTAALVQGYLRAGQPAKAEELLNSTLASDPNNAQNRVLLGSVYLASQKPNDAEAAFKMAIEKDPTSAIGYSALGELYLQSKRLDQAEKTLRDGLKQQPNNAALQLLLAMTLELTGQYDAAITAYETMLTADPRSTIAANNLASLLSEHRGDQASLDRAYTIASRFADSDVPQFLDTLGWINYLRGKYDQALPLLTTAVGKLPDAGAAQIPNAGVMQFHLAMTYKGLGQRERAEEGLKQAIEHLPPDSPEATKAHAALTELAAESNAPKGSDTN